MLFDMNEVQWVTRGTGNRGGRKTDYGIRITIQSNGKRSDGVSRLSNCVAISYGVIQKAGFCEGDRFLIGKITKGGKDYAVIARDNSGYTMCMATKGTKGTGFVKFGHGAINKEDLPFPSEIEASPEDVSYFGNTVFFEIKGGQ